MQSLGLLTTVANNRLDLGLPQLLRTGFEVFGVEFTAAWQKLLFGWWALAIVVLVGFIIRSVRRIARVSHGAQQTSSIYPIPSREEH